MKPTSQEIVEKYKKEREECLIELKEVHRIQTDLKTPDNFFVTTLSPFELEMLAKGTRNRKVELEQQINKCYRQIGKHSL